MALRKQIILNIRRDDVRVALRENNELTQFYIERGDRVTSVGNIVKGRIISKREELKAAFVDIGDREAGFLPLKDLYGSMPHKKGNELDSDILVQIKKEAYGTKGARLTTFIALPGRYLVLLPFRKIIGISRNINEKDERKRLKEVAREIRPSGMGLIIRTLATGKDLKDIKSELSGLLRTWNTIRRKSRLESAPSVLWEEEELSIKIARDLLDETVEEFIVNSGEAYSKIKKYLKKRKSSLIDRVKLYEKPTPIFNHYNIEQEMRKIFRRKIWLKSGGYIVIDKTEALTVFDVNSGKYRGKKDTENMIYRTNSEAAFEIARQLRLRDIGGIIIIDFIDMTDKKKERSIIDRFRSYLKRDKAKFKISPELSPYGLLEMTRERVRRSISKRFTEKCPYCDGKGHVLSSPYLFSKFTSWIEKKNNRIKNSKVRIIANPRIVNYFETEGKDSIERFCVANNMHIEIVPREEQSLETIKIITLKDDETITEEI